MIDVEFGPPGEDSIYATASIGPRWYACYTRARHEKRVAALLHERGIESFLPLQTRDEQWSDRRKRVTWPLFPSYVFGRFDLAELTRVLGVYGVVSIVRTGGAPTPIADEDIQNVRRFAEAIETHGLTPEIEPLARVGDWVRIGSGPLSGVEGIVVERRGRARVVIGLQAIGQGLSVDVGIASLQPVRGRPASLQRGGASRSPAPVEEAR